MPLDDLVSVIETLQQRIATHRQSLQQNETRTRTALIDPLLTALGWDVSDPALVTPEYSVDGGWADYALRGPGNQPAAIVEAKRLGTLVENHLSQMVNYCIQEGIAYAGVTDGSRWELYRTFEPVPMADKIVLDLNISNTVAYECALQLLLLWRPNLASGRTVAAREPIVGWEPEVQRTASAPDVQEAPSVAESPQPNPVSLPPVQGEWVSLAEYDPPSRSDPPQSVHFPDDKVYELRRWNDILVAVAMWLSSTSKLTAANTPVESSPRIYMVHDRPIHPTGNRFFQYREIADGRLVVNTHGSAVQIRSSARKLLQHCGVSPDTVHLRVGQ